MTDVVKVALIAATPVTVLGLIQVWLDIGHRQKLTEIHVQINSRLDQLLNATSRSSYSDGKAEGIVLERDRIATKETP